MLGKEPTRAKHLTGLPSKGRLLALPPNTRLGEKVKLNETERILEIYQLHLFGRKISTQMTKFASKILNLTNPKKVTATIKAHLHVRFCSAISNRDFTQVKLPLASEN